MTLSLIKMENMYVRLCYLKSKESNRAISKIELVESLLFENEIRSVMLQSSVNMRTAGMPKVKATDHVLILFSLPRILAGRMFVER